MRSLMEAQKLNTIAEWCQGRLLNATPALVATDISTDSRAVKAGDLFVALAGDKFDAHEFLGEVSTKGAVAAVIDQNRAESLPKSFPAILVSDTRKALGKIGAAYRAGFEIPTVAIAGSNGKTSTKELIAAVISEKLKALWSPASFNNDIGVPLTMLQLAAEHRAAVFEVGTNHPGELRPLIEMIRPRIGIITSIGREHLEFFGTIEGVLQEEGTLAELLPAGGLLLINGDGYGSDSLLRRTVARVIRVGIGKANDWRIRDVTLGADGSRFTLETESKEFSGEYNIKLLGSHQVVNATYAIVVGKELGLGRAEIQRGLASCAGAKMRLQPKRIDDFLVLDDAYNANADSMQAALETLQVFPCQGRRIAVLGDMGELGESSVAAHQEVGRRVAETGIDCLVAVGKSSGIMAAAARNAGLSNVVDLPEIEKAGAAVTEIVRPGDVVLVKASRSTRLERVIEYLSEKFKNGHATSSARGN
ncbi:MAG TPA: UDP-N-acetylmuramoyl-tripeptide--D-alanyl-D-alanine ligase [Candidatus Kapabacteria bacterium]|nr:UDP-N-acetylmuramoyl-tripeptide--D-alanyl-D-alanine ligase [Candidatus Kapabacteria bacterium]